MTIRILLVDDQRLMREGLRTILSLEDDLEVVGLAENGKVALDMVRQLQPDVVLMDIRMPVMDGVVATARIHEEIPSSKVLVLTTFDDDEYIVDALKNGAVGYLLKDLPSERLIQAIREVASGHPMMQSEIAAKLIMKLTGQEDPSSRSEPTAAAASIEMDDLTDRENEILVLVAQGKNNREIAALLYISEGTVKNYVSSIYDKTGISERSKLIMYAMEQKLV